MRKLFFCTILLLFVTDFAFGDSIIQKPVQKPKDRSVQVDTYSGKLCYIPTFSLGADNGSYIGILNCSVREARPARYDLFGRIGYYINDTWQCITAPDSIATYDRWIADYVYLAPCVINDPKQKWKIKNRMFYSLDESYSIQDDGSYLYAVHRLTKKLNRHKLTASMNEWINTIAMPGNISIVTSLSWELPTKDGSERYFLYNDASQKNTTPLYYNLDKGYIAQYNSLGGTLYCMYSDVGSNDWNWVSWEKCNDSKSNKKDKTFWNPVSISENKFAFEDKDGNILRVTGYGAHWGVPYTVKPMFLEEDTGKSQTSEFLTDGDFKELTRFINANVGANLEFCPAGGHNLQRTLKQSPWFPSNFELTQEWIQRLYAISQTTAGAPVAGSGVPATSGFCGVCLLHSYQMIAELLENPYQPRHSGGYFFNTAAHTNPFISFRERHSILHDTLADISQYINRPLNTVSDAFYRILDRAYAGSISMLPQYEWHLLGRVDRIADIDTLLSRLFSASAGRVYLAVYVRTGASGSGFAVHAMVLLRINNGVIAIPTNIETTLEAFTQSLTPARNVNELHAELSRAGSFSQSRELLGLGIFEVRGMHRNEFESIISVRDCTGEGEGRRGNTLIPLPELLNQCISGRCF
ncbi:DUF1561 family protein [Helicobacter apodemus]|uniref:DUF1561 family protein n=1 Tax=Helicobacter apodemus TaxID=135569 RepID=A0A2U8FDB9_9HELI|nr:DUF1561 family protein [Helicobacter apodemus]AWI34153.1 hypothetical protein CDV25_04775 [Helicobacter apodemus]